MGLSQRTKGKVGERQVAKLLQSLGYPSARRSAQHMGTTDSSDVLCDELKHLFIEVKYGPKYSPFGCKVLLDEFAKADKTAGDKEPVIFTRSGGSVGGWWLMYHCPIAACPVYAPQNAAKRILDHLNSKQSAEKVYAETPGAVVTVREVNQ